MGRNEAAGRGYRTVVGTIAILLLLTGPAVGQRVVPGGITQEAQLITLTSKTPFDQALRIIQAFSNRMIVDPFNLTSPIGVDIDRQPWLLALVEITRHNGLYVIERTGYYELAAEESPQAPTVSSEPEITPDTHEVNISAVFFQVDRSAIRDLGVDWTTLSSGRVDVRAGQSASNLVSNEMLTVGVSTRIGNSVSVDALLKTFERKNVGEVVANPQIKVQDRKTGYIQVGSDFSVTTTDFAGNAITQFFSTGTILTVTPHVISQDSIVFVDLEVEAERSSLVDPVRNLISKTVARTSALLRDGEQTAIGGLYGQEIMETRSGVPFLKDLPGWFLGLRYLFGHTGKQVNKTELVVLLKVDLVPSVRERVRTRPSDAGALRLRERSRFEETLRDLNRGGSPKTRQP